MAKLSLGIDIGHDSMKLALVNGRSVKKTAVVEMPDNMVRDGRITSIEAVGELLRDAMKKHGMRCKDGALVLNGRGVFVRDVVIPQMTPEQLMVNLPYEFRDYITDELQSYVYDYAMISTLEELLQKPEKSEDGEEEGATMHLMAAAVPAEVIREYRAALRKAGLKLKVATPAVCCYPPLVLSQKENKDAEYCVLDLGHEAIRMFMYKGFCETGTRVLDIGLSRLVDAIAEQYNVDVHLAHNYLLTNYDNCQNNELFQDSYGNIAVELMRALNFYRFSTPDSELNEIWLCGGGASIPALQTAIRNNLEDMEIHTISELLTKTAESESSSFAAAIGVTQQ